MGTKIEHQREQFERQFMEATPPEKTWHVPAHQDKGPVTIELTIPQVRVTDSDGRHIVLSPEQLSVVSTKLEGVSDWLQHGDTDWVAPD